MAGKRKTKAPQFLASAGATARNKLGQQAQFARAIVNHRVDPRYVPMLLRDMATQADALAVSLSDSLHDPTATLRANDKSRDAVTVEVTIRVTTQPTVSKNSAKLRRKNKKEP